MGIVFRQSVKTTIITFIGALLGALSVFLSTQFLSKQEYGFTRNLTSQAVMATQIFLFGLHNTLSVYIHHYADEDKRKQVLITICFFLPIILIIVATVLYYCFQYQIIHWFQPQDIPFMERYFMWLPVFTLFFSYQTMLELYLNSQMKIALATFVREIVLRFINIGLILLLAVRLIDFDSFVMGTVLVYLVPIFLLFYFSSRLKGFGLSFDLKVFTGKEYKELLHFSWYHALLTISITLLGILDTLMLAPLSKNGLKDVAIYTVAVFFISALQIPYKSMTNSSFPSLAQAFKNNDRKRTEDIFHRSSINILIASVGLVILICCSLPNIVMLMRSGYEQIIPIVLILIIGVLIDIATGMNGHVLSLSNYYKANFYMSLVLVGLMVTFNLILIPRIGIYGAAWSNAVALTFYNIAKSIYVWKKLQLQPFSKATLITAICGLAALTVGYFLPFIINPYVDTIIRSVAIGLTYTGMLLWLKPSKDISIYLQSIRENKRLF